MKINPQERLASLFDQKKCWTIEQLTHSLPYSTISIRRFLKDIGYYSSFTHNSMWYTLHSIPAFNRRGLWFYQDIGFSKHGNLKQTILNFVNKSPHGLTAKELFEILLIPVNMSGSHIIKLEVKSWNPFTGCTKISPACKNCYAEGLALKLNRWGTAGYENKFQFTVHQDRLEKALLPLKSTVSVSSRLSAP